MAVTVNDLEVSATSLDLGRAAKIYQDHGVLVVRGLSTSFVLDVLRDISEILDQSLAMLSDARRDVAFSSGWVTPDGSLFNEDPERPGRLVINKININAKSSAAFLRSTLNPALLDVLESLLGPNIELWKWGHTIYRPPQTKIPKSVHQDEFYFEHKHNSSLAVINYTCKVDGARAPIVVVPGTHRLGLMEHVDDQWAGFALPDTKWRNCAIPIEGQSGDAIIVHGLTVHGSLPNRSDESRPVFIQRYRRAGDFCVVQGVNQEERTLATRRTEASADDVWMMARGLRRYSKT